ncbi:MAG: alpha/beta hydrolase [Promethearchaeota archaeon]
MVKKSFIDNPTVSRQIFFPPPFRALTKFPDSFIKELHFRVSKKITLGGYFFLIDSNFPTLLLFHGNAELAFDYVNTVDFFFDCGVNLAVADYRGYGFSSGKPIYSSLISDALPIFNELNKWMIENRLNNSIFILGRSIGSVCASEIGAHNPDNLQGIIFSSGFASMYNMMTRLFRISGPGISPEGLKEFSNDTRIRKFQKPVLIIHGTQDFVIPSNESNQIYDIIPDGVEKKLILIEDADHNNIFLYRDEYFTPLKNFIQKHK